MAPRRTYEGGLVQGVAIPNIGFEQYEAQRRASADLNEKLQQIKTFALKSGAYEAELRAADYVAGNAPDLSLYERSSLEDRKKLEESGYFKGKVTDKTFTLYDRAVREHQINYIKSKFQSMAITNFESVRGAAELSLEGPPSEQVTLDFFREIIQSQVNGLSDAVIEIDGEAGLEVRADLAKLGDAYYQDYMGKVVKNESERNAAEIVAETADTFRAIPRFFSYGNLVPFGTDENGDYQSVAVVSYLLGPKKEQIQNELIARGITAENLKKWTSDWDKRVLDGAVDTAISLSRDTTKATSRSALSGISLSANMGNFSGDENLKGLYEQLRDYPDRQEAILKGINDWVKEGILRLEKEEQLSDKVQKSNLADQVFNYQLAIKEKDYNEADKILAGMYQGTGVDGTFLFDATNPDILAEIQKHQDDFNTKESGGFFLDKETQSMGYTLLTGDSLTIGWLNENKGKIGYDQYNDLTLKLEAKKDERLTDAINRLKVAYDVKDLNITGPAMSNYAEEFKKAYNDLFDWYLLNKNRPGTTSKTIYEYAVSLSVPEITTGANIELRKDIAAGFENGLQKMRTSYPGIINILDVIEATPGYDKTIEIGENLVNNRQLRLILFNGLQQIDDMGGEVPKELFETLSIYNLMKGGGNYRQGE